MAEDSSGNTQSTSATFHGWRFKHYFKIVEEGDKNIQVRCTLCPGNKTLSSARNTTSNFKTHLDRVHKTLKLVAKESPQANLRGPKRKKVSDEQQSAEGSQSKKQCTLSNNNIPLTRLRNLLSQYVIEDMQPLSTVESPAFRKLIGGLCCTQVPDRKSFTLYLDKVYDEMVQRVREALERVEYVSTTVDIWSAHNKSFLGMTAHWIDPVTLHRCKAALACTRITGRHTYDVLGAKIEQIHNGYNLAGKVTATITDNGSNFVKSFAMFHQSPLDSSSTTAEEAAILSMDDDSDESLENTETEEVIFENMDDLLTVDTEDDHTQVQYDLPAHERCAAHTLNLIASTDIDKFLSTSPISRNLYRSSVAKCLAVWNKASRSTIASDSIQEIAKRKFLVPSKTRWNLHYEAILRITENSASELNELCTKMGLCSFVEKEIVFLKEYCSVMKPLARGLDIL